MPNVYELITDRLISSLEAGVIPWRKPWSADAAPLAIPTNRQSGKPYRGCNAMLLMFAGYASSQWVTYKQAQALGAQVRKGEKGWPIIFWKFDQGKDGDSPLDRKFAFARAYTVFNVAQCDGFPDVEAPLPFAPPSFDRIASADALAERYMTSASHPTLAHGGNVACYLPHADHVDMPHAITFSNREGYYSTLFHELAHSTGHASRLDRLKSTRKGSEEYAHEELCAEFAAAFMCAEAGISDARELDNSAAYISHWLGVLRNDKTMAVAAAQRAQKAVDLMVGRTSVADDSMAVAA